MKSEVMSELNELMITAVIGPWCLNCLRELSLFLKGATGSAGVACGFDTNGSPLGSVRPGCPVSSLRRRNTMRSGGPNQRRTEPGPSSRNTRSGPALTAWRRGAAAESRS